VQKLPKVVNEKTLENLQLKFWCRPNYERLLRSICIDEKIDHCDAIGNKNINCPILVWDFK